MSSFKKNINSLRYNFQDHSNFYKNLIKPYNSKYFLYNNKYYIKYEYYNVFMYYISNGDYNNLHILLYNINNFENKKKKYIEDNKDNKYNKDNKDNKDNKTPIIISYDDDNRSHNIKKNVNHIKEYDYTKKKVEDYYSDYINKKEDKDNGKIKDNDEDKNREHNDENNEGNNIDTKENNYEGIEEYDENNKKQTNIILPLINNEKKSNVKYVKEERIITQDEIITNIQEKLLKKIWEYKIQDRLPLFSKMKFVRSFNNEHNYSIDVSLLDNYVVRKILKYNSLGFVLFKSEVTALLKLNRYPYFPKILTFDPKRYIIYMSYCGEQINYDNCPSDWYSQFGIISEIMKKENITSSDIIDRNICILSNRIHIIDFGLSNQFSESVNTSIKKLYNILSKYGEKKKYISY